MRNNFDRQLDTLNNDLITMGAMCENAIACSVKALLNSDNDLADTAVKIDKEIDRKERDIESLCIKLLLQQQPVAGDLRLISAALKMVTDMERIGDQAADIAELIPFVKNCGLNGNMHINDMAAAVIKMVTDSVDAFVNNDLGLAKAVIQSDDTVDMLFVKIKNDLISLIASSKSLSESALDLLMIAKYLERIGDHATNIAEWVVFSITGEHIGE